MSQSAEAPGSTKRIGARALLFLGTPPNSAVITALADEALSLAALQAKAGSPGSTLRVRMKKLSAAGVVSQRNAKTPGGPCEYELTPAGKDLLHLVGLLERWLRDAPGGCRTLGGDTAKAAVGALAEGWSSALLRALVVKPLSIADLDGLIAGLNYPSVERRVAAMRRAGQVEALPAGGRETPYAVTEWLRRAGGPLLAAARWERRHLNGTAPLAGIDIETILLLAMPLVAVEIDRSGSCRLAVELPTGGNGHRRLAGAIAEFEQGTLRSCTTRLDGKADAWSSGSLAAWLEALVDGDTASLELGGESRLARTVVDGLHRALFAPPTTRREDPLVREVPA